ncbi:MAG: hypothetical protein ACT4OX_16410 [Actinomycetota bacterium]
MGRVATTVWRISGDLVLALDEHLGAPVDSYLNGSQTWLIDDESGVMLEWRLHPVARYRLPTNCSHYDVWESVVGALSTDPPTEPIPLGTETRSLTDVWDGLECFAAYGDEVEPQTLASRGIAALGIAPDGVGLVDHDAIGDAWERARGDVSIVGLVLEHLQTS